MREAPAQALRAVFSGIGQVLLVADRLKTRATEPDRAHAPAGQDGAPRDETRWRSLDETGNVRVLSETPAPVSPAATEPAAAAEPADAAGPGSAAPPAADAAPAEPAAPTEQAPGAEPAAAPAEPAAAGPAAAGPAQPELPVPNYDDLSVASLRARLRNLDQSQVRVLLEYEKDHAGRAAVLTMFENRIAKLESGEA
ncbi:MAG TPA: hypothetical protein VH480_07530 [Streptosporangiaceae bacterium]